MIGAHTAEPISVNALNSMSHSDIEKVLDVKADAPVIAKEPEPAKAKEPEATEPNLETAPQQEQDEPEVELPKGVEKRIAKEVARQAELDRKIQEARSATKAKEDELAKLTGKPGAEPAKNTEPEKNARPVRPDIDTFPGTLAEFYAAVAKYEADLEKYLEGATRQTVEQEFTEREQKQRVKEAWDSATKTHGAEFPKLMETLAASAPQDLQIAISSMENWDGLAVHLAKNLDELKAIVEIHEKSPARAIAALGKLEDRLSATAVTRSQPEKLPAPIKPIGGGGAAEGAIDLNKLEGSALRRQLHKLGIK